MKDLILITIIVGFLISCSKDNFFDPEQYPQKWHLVKMTGSMTNYEATGNDMEWQEFYLLNSNGTFFKSRQRDSVLTEVFGTYSYVNYSEENFLVLIFETKNSIIGSCFSEPKEHLLIISDIKMVSTWGSCDGAGLEYKRIQ